MRWENAINAENVEKLVSLENLIFVFWFDFAEIYHIFNGHTEFVRRSSHFG